MNRTTVLAVLCLFVAGASAQFLETTIPLPDTLGGVGYPAAMAYNSTANRIYAGGSPSDRIAVVDAATGARVARILTPPGEGIASLCHNPANNKLYASTYAASAKLLVIDGATNGVLATIPMSGYVYSICVNPATNQVYCTNSNKDSVTVIDGSTNGVVTTVKVGDGPYALCVNTTGNRVYCSSTNDSSVTVIDGATNGVVATVRTGRRPLALCWNSQQNKVYSANSTGGSVTVIARLLPRTSWRSSTV